jgi:NAD+ kinase
VVEGKGNLLAPSAAEGPLTAASCPLIEPVPMALGRVGLVVHPSRSVEHPVRLLTEWAAERGIELVQVRAPCQQQVVAELADAEDCDVIVSVGGDGTTLAAIRVAATAGRPVMGIACGSVGALTIVATDDAAVALERFALGEWTPRGLPALQISAREERTMVAFNDLAVIRSGQGQLRVNAAVDGVTYIRFAGDGCIVSSPTGASAYAFAAGGPLLAQDADVFLFTPVSAHGGSVPPLVMGSGSELTLEIDVRWGSARFELDGQIVDADVAALAVKFCPSVVTAVTFADGEPFLTGLRRRRLLIDGPRILAEDGLT